MTYMYRVDERDFRTKAHYAHLKSLEPNMSDEELVLYHIYKTCDRELNYMNVPYVLPADVKYHTNEKTHDGEVKVALREMKPRFYLRDGGYDIWLRNFKNVTYVALEIEGLGCVYEHIVQNENVDKDIQIPLGFHSNKEPVKFLMLDTGRCFSPARVSFIPTYGMSRQHTTIKLNAGAEATIELSSVYLTNYQKLGLRNKTIEFYVGPQIIHTNKDDLCHIPSLKKKEKRQHDCLSKCMLAPYWWLCNWLIEDKKTDAKDK